jgi:hypothetical protein
MEVKLTVRFARDAVILRSDQLAQLIDIEADRAGCGHRLLS